MSFPSYIPIELIHFYTEHYVNNTILDYAGADEVASRLIFDSKMKNLYLHFADIEMKGEDWNFILNGMVISSENFSAEKRIYRENTQKYMQILTEASEHAYNLTVALKKLKFLECKGNLNYPSIETLDSFSKLISTSIASSLSKEDLAKFESELNRMEFIERAPFPDYTSIVKTIYRAIHKLKGSPGDEKPILAFSSQKTTWTDNLRNLTEYITKTNAMRAYQENKLILFREVDLIAWVNIALQLDVEITHSNLNNALIRIFRKGNLDRNYFLHKVPRKKA